MSNVIYFNGDTVHSGEERIEDLVRSLIDEDNMNRSFLVSMNEEGSIRINISGEFYGSEMLYALEIIKKSIMTQADVHE